MTAIGQLLLKLSLVVRWYPFLRHSVRLQCQDMLFSCSLANKTARLIMLSSYNIGCRRTGSCLPGRCHEFRVSPISLYSRMQENSTTKQSGAQHTTKIIASSVVKKIYMTSPNSNRGLDVTTTTTHLLWIVNYQLGDSDV